MPNVRTLTIDGVTYDLQDNVSGYITSYTETDPTVPSWAKALTKPSYSLSEISDTTDLQVIENLSGFGLLKKEDAGVWSFDKSTYLTSSSTLDAANLNGVIPSAVTATTQASTDNSTKIATTAYVTTAIAALPEPMLFKGSVGTGGTITALPAAASSNEGFTYKVITDLSTPVVAKVGDTVISNGSSWIVIPSGDEPSGTVTSIGLSNATNGGLSIGGSPITSSGTITVGHTNVLTSAQTTQAVYPIAIDKNGHISEYGSAVTIPTKTSDLTNDSNFMSGMTILRYGSSTWNDFLTAYQSNHVVYCRASSNANPASGAQLRLAFMAYVAGSDVTPTEVEFQYYRSVSSHTEAQQGDQVYVYKLTNKGVWSVTVREASVKVVAGTGLGGTYSNGTMTLTGPTKVSDLTNDSGFITSETDPVFSASAAAGITSSNISTWSGKQDALVSGTNIKTINNQSLLGSGDLVIQSGVGDVQVNGTSVVNENAIATVTVPTATSDLTNDSGFITGYTETDPVFTSSVAYGISSSDISGWNSKQNALVSGTNIKTINNQSLLGSGNIDISSGDSDILIVNITYDDLTDTYLSDQSASYIYNASLSGTAIIANVYWEGSSEYSYVCFSHANEFTSEIIDPDSGDALEYVGWEVYFYGLDCYSGTGTSKEILRNEFLLREDYTAETEVIYDQTLYIINNPSPGTGSSYPTMNGTRSLGSNAGYARVDHVHPKDTSKQDTLVSGTNIKTINGTSLLGSGDISITNSGTSVPTANETAEFDSSAKMNSTNMTSSEVTDFVESLDISGGGSSVPTFNTATITLTTAGWSNNSQTVTVQGVTASNIVIVNPAPASYDEYVVDNVRCTGQSANSLTFTCDFVPNEAITVSVIITSVTAVYGGEVS